MKHLGKRLLALLLALLMTVSCLGLTAFAEGEADCAEGHAFGDWTVTAAAGCETPGLEERVCEVCGLTETQEIPATGHAFGDWFVAVEAGCETPGALERVCAYCGLTETQEIPATRHAFGDWAVTVEALCEEPGLEERVCASCGLTETQEIPAAGHAFGDWTVSAEPDCETPGLEERVCASCGLTETNELPAFGHDFVDGFCILCGVAEAAGEENELPAPEDADGEEDAFEDETVTASAVVEEEDEVFASDAHTVTIIGQTNCSVSARLSYAESGAPLGADEAVPAGQTVYLSVTPTQYYALQTLNVTNTVTDETVDVYTYNQPYYFTMPDAPVTVSVVCAKGPWGELQELLDGGGTVTLTKDYESEVDSRSWTVSGNVALDLNGHTITVDDATAFIVTGNLSLSDSAGGGVITGGSTYGENGECAGAGVRVCSGGSFTMTGGTISGNNARWGGGVGVYGSFTMTGGTISGNSAKKGGGVYVSGGSFTMSGGTISGNTMQDEYGGGVYAENGAQVSLGGVISDNYGKTQTSYGSSSTYGYGGGVYAADSSTVVTIDGATISGNRAQRGGGVYLYMASVSMNSGSITGNDCTAYHNGGKGAGVAVYSGSFTMLDGSISANSSNGLGGGIYSDYGLLSLAGGTISGNNATGMDGESGGGLYFTGTGSSSKVKLSGDAVISGNTKGSATDNIYIKNGYKLIIDGELSEDALFGVTAAAAGVFTDGLSGKGGLDNFFSDSEDYELVLSNGEARLGVFHTISFDGGAAEGTMEDVRWSEDEPYKVPACGFTAPEGQMFIGWTDGTEVYSCYPDASENDSLSITEDTILTPIFADAITLTVTGAGADSVRTDWSALHSIDEQEKTLNGYVTGSGVLVPAGAALSFSGIENGVVSCSVAYSYDEENSCYTAQASDEDLTLALPSVYAVSWTAPDTCAVSVQPESAEDPISTGTLVTEGETVSITLTPIEHYTAGTPVVTNTADNTSVEVREADAGYEFTMPGAPVSITFDCQSDFTVLQGMLDEGGTLVLTRDYYAVSSDPVLVVTTTVALDLNGHTVSGCGVDRVFNIQSGGSLTLSDSADGGMVTGGVSFRTNGASPGGGVYIFAGGSLILNSGSICGNSVASDDGGNISANGGGVAVYGSFIMNGGSVSDNNCRDRGGGVFVGTSGSFIMNGGVISGNSCVKHASSSVTSHGTGGGVAVLGSFTMNGGTISGNSCATSTYATPYGCGGGVYVYGSDTASGVFTMTGGTITGNSAQSEGDGVYKDANGVFNISGAPVVTGNLHANTSREENFFLKEGDIINVTGALTEGARIGVCYDYAPAADSCLVFTSGLSEYGDASVFVADYSSKNGVRDENGEAALAKKLTLTFNKNSGTGTNFTEKVIAGAPYTLPECPFGAPENEFFMGWTMSTSSNPEYYEPGEQLVFTTDNPTLYACWKTGRTVSFAPGGGSGSMDSEYVKLGAYTLPEPADTLIPGRRAYSGTWVDLVFVGWRFDNKTYPAGYTVEITDNTTITALWGSNWDWVDVQFHGAPNDGTEYVVTLNRDIVPLTGEEATLAGHPIYIENGMNIVLDLNGHTVDRGLNNYEGSITINAFTVAVGGVFTVRDSAGGGTIKGAGALTSSGSQVGSLIEAKGSFVLQGGEIKLNKAGGYGVVHVPLYGSFLMTGGSIMLSSGEQPVSVLVDGGTAELRGGTLGSGNKDSYTGTAVRALNGSFTMTGGTIEFSQYGIETGSGASVTQTGGLITKNSYGVYVRAGTFCVSDSAKVTGNYASNRTVDVYLPENTVITVTGALSEDASIGVCPSSGPTNGSPRVFTSGLPGKGTTANFTSDDADCELGYNAEGEALMGLRKQVTFTNYGFSQVGPFYIASGCYFTLPEEAPGSYSSDFAGWERNGTLYQPGDGLVLTESTEFVGTWVSAYKISYQLNGGSLPEGASNPTRYSSVSGEFTLVNPVREGHSFRGWTGTGIEGLSSEVVFSGDEAETVGARSYTAVWKIDALEGDGTENSPYLIRTAADWSAFVSHAADANCAGEHFLLSANITVSEMVGGDDDNIYFNGCFDGGNNTVSGLTVSAPDVNYLGLFRRLGSDGVVENLNITGFSISGRSYIGAAVGYSSGTVRNVSVSGSSISGLQRVGGVAGYGKNVENCRAASSVTVGSANLADGSGNYSYHGGVVGYASTVSGCFSAASVTGAETSTTYYGGIAGIAQYASNCFAYGASIEGSKNSGILFGGGYSESFENNLYRACSFNGTALDSGCGIGADYSNNNTAGDVTGAAAPGYTLSLPENVSTNAPTVFVYNGSVYFGEGATVTLSYLSSALEPGYVPRYDLDDCVFDGESFTMPGYDATVNVELFRFLSGHGTEEDPYLIDSDEDWEVFAAASAESVFSGKYFLLTDDISAAAMVGSEAYPFQGSFDGGAYTVSGLEVCEEEGSLIGLFRVIGAQGSVQNLVVSGFALEGASMVGAIAGKNYGLIDRVTVSGSTVSGETDIGGVAGYSLGGINAASVTDTDVSGYKNVGGVLGHQEYKKSLDFVAYTSNCTVSASVTVGTSHPGSDAFSAHGGVVGYIHGDGIDIHHGDQSVFTQVSSCFSAASVTADGEATENSTQFGGLVGYLAKGSGATYNAVFGASVSGGGFTGAIFGEAPNTSAYSSVGNNCYRGCTLNGTARSSDIGAGKSASSNSLNDWSSGSGFQAVPVYAVSLAEGVSVTPDKTPVSVGGVDYYINSTKITLSYSGSGEVLAYFRNGAELSGNTFYISSGDAVVTVELKLSGSGTEEDPYLIENDEDWLRFCAQSRRGNCAGEYFELRADITAGDMAGIAYSSNSGAYNNYFRGFFDGKNHKVSGLNVNSTERSIGLFRCVGPDGEVKNLKLEGFTLSGNDYVGAAAGYTYKASLENITVSGSEVSGTSSYVGGLLGCVNYGTAVRNCEVLGSVVVRAYNLSAGGLIGLVSGSSNSGGTCVVSGCISAASVYNENGNLNGSSRSGGLIGYVSNYCTIEDCYVFGASVEAPALPGAFIGQLYKTTTNNATLTRNYYGSVTLNGASGTGCGIGRDSYSTSNVPEDTHSESYDVEGGVEPLFTVTACEDVSVQGPEPFVSFGETDYYRAGDEFTLAYSGALNPFTYTVNGALLVGGVYSFTMPAEDVYVDIVTEYVTALAASLTLEGEIGLNFRLKLPDSIKQAEGAKAVFCYKDKQAKLIELSDLASSETKEYVFTYRVPVKGIANTVGIQIVDGDGDAYPMFSASGREVANGLFEFAVADYGAQVTDEQPTLKALTDALQNYGYYTQRFFGSADAAPALATTVDMSGITADYLSGHALGKEGTVSGLTLKSMFLTLDSETAINLRFTLGSGASLDDYTFTCGDDTLTAVKSGSTCVVKIANIPAKDLDTVYTVTVTHGGETMNVSCSALTYVYLILSYPNVTITNGTTYDNLCDAMKAMVLYNEAADAFL